MSVLVRDGRTGRTRKIFQTLDNRRDGGFEETMRVNRNAGHDLYPLSAMTKVRQREVRRKRTEDLRKGGLPLGLYVPGSCGSSLFYHNIFRGSFQKRLQDLQTDEECSWLDPDRDTAWRNPIRGSVKTGNKAQTTEYKPRVVKFK